MEDGYPDEKELETIKSWDFSKGSIQDFLDFIVDIWWMPSWGWHLKKYKTRWTLYTSTGGWSGNEEIISSWKRTEFWTKYNKESKPGGHYKFVIPVKDINFNK